MKEIHVGSYLGSGFENDCYKIVDESGQDTGGVVQVLNGRGRMWQHDDPDYMNGCLELLHQKANFTVDPSVQVIEDAVLVMQDGTRNAVNAVRVLEFDEHFDDFVVTFGDLKEVGVPLLRKIMDVVHDGHRFRKDYELGLDPMGADLVMDVFKGVPQYLALSAGELMPGLIKQAVRSKVKGIEGKARNFLLRRGQFEITDVGMHDLSKNGKLAWVMRQYGSFTFAGLIELIKYINTQLEDEGREFIPCEEIDALPCEASKFHKFVAKQLMKMMIPLFERFDEVDVVTIVDMVSDAGEEFA